MTFYHLRYNIYAQPGFAVEKERWIKFDSPLNDSQVKEYLEHEHQDTVSIIMCKVVCLEEYEEGFNRVY